MSQHDGITARYDAGFQAAVRGLLRPPVGGWGPTYTDEAAIEQALRRAYQQGRMDGVTEALGHPDAPRAVNDEPEVPRLSQEEVWADLGLFEPSAEPPRLRAVTLDPMDPAAPTLWAVQQARKVLGLSLAEATEFVVEVLR